MKTGTKQVKTGTRTEDVWVWKQQLVKVEKWEWQRLPVYSTRLALIVHGGVALKGCASAEKPL